MREYKIAAIPGDGIGKEVLPEGLKVLQAVAENTGAFRLAVEEYPWGCEHYLEAGEVMPEDGIDILRNHDVVYFGAGGHPRVPDYPSAWQLIKVDWHPTNLRLCKRGEWNVRMLIETILSTLTYVCDFKHSRHKVWDYFKTKLGFTMALFNILVQWRRFQPDENGFAPLSIAEFSL